jgi:hypothetical protein
MLGWTCGYFSMDLHCLFVVYWNFSGWDFDLALRPHGYVETMFLDLPMDLPVGQYGLGAGGA